ncbi:helix-turn-helix domain-containing protein [Acetobacterium paludosum]
MLGISKTTIHQWICNYNDSGIDGLKPIVKNSYVLNK